MKTITFYSYKGGVGRSLALVNIATRLIEFGKSVCLLDFDLEAPGLNLKFDEHINREIKNGIVDYIYDFSNEGVINKNIAQYAIKFNISKNQLSPSYLIPSGNTESRDYWKKLSAINWYEMLYEKKNGLAFFLDLKDKIARQLKPEFLLIDSRTGISEISGVTLSLLADEIVVLAANNKENLEGAAKIIDSIKNSRKTLFGTEPEITFVLSRIPFTERPEDKVKELALVNKIKESYFKDTIDEVSTIHSDRELEEGEKIKIGYDKTDISISQVSRDYLLLFEKVTRNSLSKEEIQKFNDLKIAENLWIRSYQKSISLSQRLESINKAIQLDSYNVSYYVRRINIYVEMRDLDQALFHANSFSKVYSNLPMAFEILGFVLVCKSEYVKANEEFKRAISLDENNFGARFMLATNYNRLGRNDEAIQLFKTLLERGYKNAPVYNGISNSFRKKGNYEEALKSVYQAINLDPKFSIAIATFAEIKASQGLVEEFYINFERAILVARETENGQAILEDSISEEDIYKNFELDERFKGLLDKYSMHYNYKFEN
jgi:MinD-like ATPase involved in chromosome partitioning or flagellar assembly